MGNNNFEFNLTLNGTIVGTSFKNIEELIVPYFKDIDKINFHDDGYGNVTIENKYWYIYIYLSDMLIEDLEEDYLLSIGYKGSFEEGEKAVKEFATYLQEKKFIYSLEYEDSDDNEYTIQHPNWRTFLDERKQKSYPEYEERQRRRKLALENSTTQNNHSFWQKVKERFNRR
ncbi:MAG TPA: hypothetical protein DIT10_14190 [Chryseobacterium sp.]|nr:hypothetical protein [Chryseobacterium sp.]